MEPGHALICGAGIAGSATAYWLNRHGWDTTVVERADRFRSGGQHIDIRGAAREVMRRMGLENAALQYGTGEKGTQFVDARGYVRVVRRQRSRRRPHRRDGDLARRTQPTAHRPS
jgi:2-polyprenyl-6-methoxyphenol hydroxylase-like FAD-dependent oxidoreductase